jgi:transcriptional antiterminator RfaH
MKHWYTLHTKPNSEYQVAAAMRQRDIEAFLPEIASPTRCNKQRMRPFFPCYLFIWADLASVSASSLQWTPGLRRMVAFNGRPVPLPNGALDLIKSKLDDLNAAGGWQGETFQRGERVRIKGGPLNGMLAIFKGPSEPSERVQVLLTFLGHAKRVDLDAADLEKAPSTSEKHRTKRPRRTRGRGRRIN